MWALTSQRDIEPLRIFLSNLVDGFHILVRNLDLLEVLGDTRRRHRFGNHTVAAGLGPCQDNLSTGSIVFLGNLGHNRVVDEQRETEAVVAKSTDNRQKSDSTTP